MLRTKLEGLGDVVAIRSCFIILSCILCVTLSIMGLLSVFADMCADSNAGTIPRGMEVVQCVVASIGQGRRDNC